VLYKDKYCSVLGTLESRYNTRRWRIKWELIAFRTNRSGNSTYYALPSVAQG